MRRAHLGDEKPVPVDEREADDTKNGEETVKSNRQMRKKALDGEKGITEIVIGVQMTDIGIMIVKTIGIGLQKKARAETKRSRRWRVNHHQHLLQILISEGLVVSTFLLTGWPK